MRTSLSNWVRWAVAQTLKSGGPIPHHVAFIMDGNRRFARKNHQEISQGHYRGGLKLEETLHWCNELGITTVTAFAFSIENFKRSKEEVDQIMDLAKDRIAKYIPELATKARIRFLGDLTLLSEDLQKIIAEAIDKSKNVEGCVLNICFGYTSTDEMSRAASYIAEGVKRDMIQPSDIDLQLFEDCLDTYGCSRPDVIVRTSGEIRLSDFLLWQSAYSCLYFCDVLWPEFSLTDFYKMIIHFQKNYPQLMEMRKFEEEIRRKKLASEENQEKLNRIQNFINWKHQQQEDSILHHLHSK